MISRYNREILSEIRIRGMYIHQNSRNANFSRRIENARQTMTDIIISHQTLRKQT